MKRRLQPVREGIGTPTVMEPALADRFGVPYVHAVVYAIDTDRVRAHVDDHEPRSGEEGGPWPFGWEVFLTGHRLAGLLDAERDHELLEAMVGSAIEAGHALGSQLALSAFDLVERGEWPSAGRAWFARWRRQDPVKLSRSLDAFWADRAGWAERLAARCLACPLDPAAAPPTRSAWAASSTESR